MKHGYEMRVFWSEEDGAYIGIAPELRGCSAHGPNPETALKELETAIELWIEARKDQGLAVPSPAERGEGKLLVRMPKSLKHELAVEAKHEGVSLNQFIVTLLAGAGHRPEVVGEENVYGVRIQKIRAVRTSSGKASKGLKDGKIGGRLHEKSGRIGVLRDRPSKAGMKIIKRH